MTTALAIRDATIARSEWGDERVAIVVERLMRTPEGKAPPTRPRSTCSRCAAGPPVSTRSPAKSTRSTATIARSASGRSLTMQTGIDGFRLIASRTGQLDGQEGPWWLDRDGTWHDAWTRDYPPEAARVLVHRKDAAHPFPGIAMSREYAQTWDGQPTGLWMTMPANQLAKCAEAQGLRKAFPNDLGGVYSDEEMERRDGTVPDDVTAARRAEAEERATAEPIGTDQVAEIGVRTKAAGLTHHELKGVLEDVAHVGQRAHVRQRDYQAVLDAIDRKARPAAPVGATVGEPEVVATGAPVTDAEPVEPEATTDEEPGGAPVDRGSDAPEADPAQRVHETDPEASAAGPGVGGDQAPDALAPDPEASGEPDPDPGPSTPPLPLGASDEDEPYQDAMYGPGAP